MTHKVTVYSAPWCPWCNKTKEWLNAHKIKYENKDVDKDPKSAEEMVKKSGQTGIPVTEIDGEIIIGYDVPRLSKALGIKG
ncbi:MAG: glutathione S-transferase N-terminal domain-containing protein [Candidatus Aenigmarchaeota archaeon]|nr:glutathione S-transferase N-terminal domain-containing protein [Candidatus Aenigmarchaeota archaeon]